MCTGIRIKATDDSVISARTVDFGVELESDVIIVPRNYKLTGRTPDKNSQGLSWETKYAFVGGNAKKELLTIDGLNEQGLAVGMFYFRRYAKYQEVSEKDYPQTIAPDQFGIWALSQFATVAEVKKALSTLKVGNVIFEKFGFVVPLHYVIYDSAGNCIVVEYVKGQLMVHENPLGTITNAPPFDWHTINLGNYTHLSRLDVASIKLDNFQLEEFEPTNDLLGLPGDFTPPSRFIRAVVFNQNLQRLHPAETGEKAVLQAFHILNNFDIPRGSVLHASDPETPKLNDYTYTPWTSACDLKSKRFYFHTYDSRRIRMVDLMNCDLDAKDIAKIQMSESEHIYDVTKDAKLGV
ncbi:choloylglycine hydrolase family protein [Microcoleus sp. N3A4]|uniref:choloylglycine hydrolase family protein n=1 Tax=Microcoleus sp. N3A4 TaxID=3055379 RepID=UPI002FD6B39C